MKKIAIIFIALLITSCGSDESKNNESIDESKNNESINSITNTILGTWIVDVEKTIEEMKNSNSFINQKDNYKQFMLKVMNDVLPHVKYKFLDDGKVDNNSPMTNREKYSHTIWNQKNNKLTMTVILKDLELIYDMNFKNSNEIKMINKQNDEIFHLIRN